MNILLVSFFNPLEQNTGSGLRSACLLRNLLDLGHTVHLFSFSSKNPGADAPQTTYPGIERSCILPRKPPSRPTILKALLKSLLFCKPLDISIYITHDVTEAFIRFMQGRQYDVVIFDQLCSFELERYTRKDKIKTIMYEHNAEFVMAKELYKRMAQRYQRLINHANYYLVKKYEFDFLKRAGCSVHVTRNDLLNFPPVIRQKAMVIPNTLPYRNNFAPKTNPGNNVVFIGSMSHFSNVDGILSFLREVWSELHGLRADIQLMIVGGNPPVAIKQYDGKYNVHVLGFVDDLAAIYRNSTLAIIPLRIGSGSRLKILEAMMHDTLNIASPKGAEGLDVQHGKHLVIADTKRDWIQAILYYMDNKAERVLLEKNAHDLVVKLYYYGSYKQKIASMLRE
jgi:glycosyltransferase involved in cell wall biosynthesis